MTYKSSGFILTFFFFFLNKDPNGGNKLKYLFMNLLGNLCWIFPAAQILALNIFIGHIQMHLWEQLDI